MKCGVSSGSALFAMLSTFFVTVNNIKCYMNHFTSFTSLMGAKPLKAVLEQIVPSYITPIKIGIRHFRVAFPHILYAYHRETYRTGIKQSHNFGLNVYARGFCVYGKLRSVKTSVTLFVISHLTAW